MKTHGKLIIATGNAHKVNEFAALLDELDVDVESAQVCGGMPEVDENADSFAGNARLKAEALRKLAPAGVAVLADDSGLEVDALEGAPGIYSARYAGPGASDAANVEKLLRALRSVPVEKRTARFRCVLCLIEDDGTLTFHAGHCEGRIADQPTGADGFGYDPVFVPAGYSHTFAELGESIKSELSHRARAVKKLRDYIQGRGHRRRRGRGPTAPGNRRIRDF